MRFPSVPPALALVLGTLAGLWAPVVDGPVAATGVAGGWTAATWAWRRGVTSVLLVSTIGTAALLGAGLATLASREAASTPLARWYGQAAPLRGAITMIEGRLREDARPSAYGVSIWLDAEGVESPAGRVRVRGGVRIRVGGRFAAARRPAWRAGRRIRVPVSLRRPPRYLNPGQGDAERRLGWRGVVLLGTTKSALLVEVIDQGGRWDEWTARAREAIRRRVELTVGRYSARSAGIVTAILIGDRAGLDVEDRRRLQRAGTYHVIAISGGNLAVVAAVILFGLRGLSGVGRISALATAAGLLAYASLVGGEPSVTRATTAAVVVLVGRAWDLEAPPLNVLGLTASLLVVWDPLVVASPGFWLTFGATAGILVGARRWTGEAAAGRVGVARWLTTPVVTVVAATVCVEIALLPVGALAFSQITFAGLLLNLAAVPLMTATQLGGALAVGLAGLAPVGASVVAWATHAAAVGLVESARLVDGWPWLSWRVAPPSPAVVVVYYLAIGAAVLTAGVRRGLAAGVATLAAGVVVTGIPVARAEVGCPGMATGTRIVFLDVDQADASFVRAADGHQLLVDAAGAPLGGEEVGRRVVVPALWALGVRGLDTLVLTHGHPDHVGGAPAVLEDLTPDRVWEGVPVPTATTLSRLRAATEDAGARWGRLRRDDRLGFGATSVVVHHPPVPTWERPRVRNDDSVVLEVRHGAVSVVLPGDIGAEVEAALAGRIPPAGLRVLKVPHHGSRTSSTERFLEALAPDVAVVSAGRESPFGHPAPEVSARLRARRIPIFETGRDGAVELCTDGRRAEMTSLTGRRWRGVAQVSRSPGDAPRP